MLNWNQEGDLSWERNRIFGSNHKRGGRGIVRPPNQTCNRKEEQVAEKHRGCEPKVKQPQGGSREKNPKGG